MVATRRYEATTETSGLLTAEQELDIARDVERLDIEVWARIVAQPAGRALVRSKLESDDPRALREADPDREGLEQVLGELAEHCPDRDFLRAVSDVNAAALRARHQLVRAHLPLVGKAIRKFDFGMLPTADLFQEGNVGLLKAAGRYDHRRGVRFATYAVWWIRHSVRRAVAQHGRLVRLPVNVVNGGHRIGKARRSLTASLGRPPTVEELAAAVELPRGKVERLQSAFAQRALPLERPTRADGEGPTVLDEAAAPTESPADRLEATQTSGALQAALAKLTPMERHVIERRFGLDGDGELTLTRLGEHYGVSRERIRQIQVAALGKLRAAMAE